ncbi:NAD-dependent deacylase [Nocardioides sambongensis]|uniref:NAD-dependent deacylase n=1 Tax=Nocardioides sambongensis TaxID=2589074 RepID=UPI001E5E20C4|nr:NAD-dependent deacylase [Nocardioides sambongensis]
MSRIVVLTGAGISAESGVPTFRDADGLWEGYHVEDVATPEAYERDPATVLAFYDERRAALAGVVPNPAHEALARLEAAVGEELLVVTQNIDDLHERGGLQRVVHMHGELLKAWCTACDQRHAWTGTLADRPLCPGCGATELRPDVVWFGEIPYEMDRIIDHLTDAEIFVSIGTSGPSTRLPGSSSTPVATAPGPPSSTSSRARARSSSTTPVTARPASWSRPGSTSCSARDRRKA